MLDLDRQRALAQRLRNEIIQAVGRDDEAVADAIEGQTEFNETVIAFAREAKRREAMAEAMKAIIADNQARKARHERAAETIRRSIGAAMMDLGLVVKPIEGPDLTVSTRPGAPSVKVVSEEMLPEQFWRTTITRSPNLAAIKTAVEADYIPGVVRTNGAPIVTLRTK